MELIFFSICNDETKYVNCIKSFCELICTCEMPSQLTHATVTFLFDDRNQNPMSLALVERSFGLLPSYISPSLINLTELLYSLPEFPVQLESFTRASLRNLVTTICPHNPNIRQVLVFFDGDLLFIPQSFRFVKFAQFFSWGFGQVVYCPKPDQSFYCYCLRYTLNWRRACFFYMKKLSMLYLKNNLFFRSIIPRYAPTLASGLMFIDYRYFVSLGCFCDIPGIAGWGGEDALLGFKAYSCNFASSSRMPFINFFYLHQYVATPRTKTERRNARLLFIDHIRSRYGA